MTEPPHTSKWPDAVLGRLRASYAQFPEYAQCLELVQTLQVFKSFGRNFFVCESQCPQFLTDPLHSFKLRDAVPGKVGASYVQFLEFVQTLQVFKSGSRNFCVCESQYPEVLQSAQGSQAGVADARVVEVQFGEFGQIPKALQSGVSHPGLLEIEDAKSRQPPDVPQGVIAERWVEWSAAHVIPEACLAKV